MLDLIWKLLVLAKEAIDKVAAEPEMYTTAQIDMAIEALEELRVLNEKLENARASRAAVEAAASDK